MLFLFLLFLLLTMGACYLYGVHVGITAAFDRGVAEGRRVCDSEWAQYMEHGAAPTPDLPTQRAGS